MPAKKKQGLYANIHAKQERIKHGSGEHMRKPGSEGAPVDEDFEKAGKRRTSGSSVERQASTGSG